ncbi:MAG: TonB-dependent receptor [Thermoanaerobaculaceae bacterium]|nr:TonB-dependent receptor [Thermoanaerobaculaceae bacterium]
MKRFVLFALLIGCVAMPLFAQNPTGTLSGHASDGKDPLPGVTVTATSPNLQGTRTSVTNGNGDYIFTFLPPGDYRVRFELQGFQTIDTTVKINAAQTQRVNATMPQAKVAEEVTVTGAYDTIASSGTMATTYEKSLINKLPVPKDLINTVALTAGVSTTGPSGNVMIAGAMAYGNLFMVNGVAIMDNVRGTPNTLYIEDAVQETTTSVSDISAEYGRFTGGVVNTLTKSGGNEFHFTARDTLTNDKWTAKTPKTTAQRQDKILNTYEATLGGFFIKDRLWFFGAYRDRKTSGNAQTYLTNEPFAYADTEKRYEGKLTLAITPNHRVIGSYFKVDRQQANYGFGNIYGPGGYNFMDKASLYTRQLPQELRAANYTGVLTDNFFVEGQYSSRKFTFENSGSAYTDLERGTWIFDPYNFSNYAFYNSPIFCAVCAGAAEKRDNTEYIGKASFFLSTGSLGSHDLVVGYDQFEDKRLSNNWQSGSSYGLVVNGEVLNPDGSIKVDSVGTPYPILVGGSGSTYLTYWPIAVITAGNDFKTTSIFANDKWRLNNNWSFNIGLRYDKNDGKNGNGAVVAKDSKISPRLSATFDPAGDGSLLFNLSYAKYVSAIANSIGDATSNAGSPATIYYQYNGPDINTNCDAASGANCLTSQQALTQMFAWFNSLTQAEKAATLIYGSIPGLSTIIPGSLNSPNADEWTIGASKRLGNNGQVRIDYINRKFHDFYMTEVNQTTGLSPSDQYGNQYDLGWIVNNDSIVSREYNGILISAQYKLTDALSLGGNYTWSTLKGNMVGETGGSGPVTGADLTYPEYKQEKWYNPKGYLSGDQRHRARIWGVWDLINTKHNRLSVSALETYSSGTPYGAVAGIDDRPYVTNPGYLSPPSNVNYYFTNRAKYTTDTITRTDLSFNYAFVLPALGTDLQFYVEPRVTNVFNEHGVTNVNTTVYTNRNKSYLDNFNPFTTAAPVECPQGTTTAHCGNWQKGPNFGKPQAPTDFQTARTFVVSFGVRF